MNEIKPKLIVLKTHLINLLKKCVEEKLYNLLAFYTSFYLALIQHIITLYAELWALAAWKQLCLVDNTQRTLCFKLNLLVIMWPLNLLENYSKIFISNSWLEILSFFLITELLYLKLLYLLFNRFLLVFLVLENSFQFSYLFLQVIILLFFLDDLKLKVLQMHSLYLITKLLEYKVILKTLLFFLNFLF